MIRWTGLAPWVFEFPFPGSLTSTFLICEHLVRRDSVLDTLGSVLNTPGGVLDTLGSVVYRWIFALQVHHGYDLRPSC